VYSLLEHVEAAEREPSPTGRIEAELVRCQGQERAAIVFHSPGRLRFRAIPVHAGARLSFAVGVDDDRACVGPAAPTFTVGLSAPGLAPALLWSGRPGASLPASAPGGGWTEGAVDMSAYAGKQVDLLLGVEFTDGSGCRPAWSRPLLRSAGTDVDVAARPVVARHLVKDILGGGAPPIEVGSFFGYRHLLQAPAPQARGSSAATSPMTRSATARLEVPPGAELEVSGEVLRGPRESGRPLAPVAFEVRIDGASALVYRIDPPAAPVTFTRTIPLSSRAGRPITVELRVSEAGEGRLAWWTSASVWRDSPVDRQLPRRGRNLLLVVVDTLRADHLRLYGGTRDTAPNLDRLAADALVFERAFAPCSWTQPSVATVLTGLSPIHHGVIGGVALRPDIETLAEVLQRRGFTSFAVSSNPIIGRREGFQRGFETFVQVPWARAEVVSAVFDDWLEEHRDLRWFAYVHYIDPHDAYNAPVPKARSFTSGLEPLRPDLTWERLRESDFGRVRLRLRPQDLDYLRAAYDDEIRYWDSGFRRPLDSLRRAGLLDDTVVVVVADHGEEFLEHGKLFHGSHLYDETIRVPLLIRAPGLVAAGREQHLFELGQLKSLLADLSSGRPLDPGALRHPDPVFSHTAMSALRDRYGTLAAVRDLEWKYVLRLEDGSGELYDLRRDPAERVDRAQELPSVRARYRSLLQAWLGSGAPSRPAWRDPDLLERMRALGYVR